jgi:TetR/AcrR family transcriptional repressor of nem operon
MLAEGERLFHLRGFRATTVNDILEAAGVPKGSFYHYFGSKAKFGATVIEDYTNAQIELFRSWADRDGLSIAERFGGYFDDMIRDFVSSDYSTSCLLSRFASDVAATDPGLRSKINESYARLYSAYVELLDVARERGELAAGADIAGRAATILALVQGAFVVGLANRNVDYLESVAKNIRDLAGA